MDAIASAGPVPERRAFVSREAGWRRGRQKRAARLMACPLRLLCQQTSLVGPGGQAGTREGGLEEPGLFTCWVPWRTVQASGLWFDRRQASALRNGAQRLQFGKEVLCSAGVFFEADWGRPVSPVKAGWFSSLIPRGFRSLPVAALNPFAFGKGSNRRDSRPAASVTGARGPCRQSPQPQAVLGIVLTVSDLGGVGQ